MIPPQFTQVSSISFFSHFQTLFQSSKKKNHKKYMGIFPKIRLQLFLDPIPNKGTKKTIRRNLSLNKDHSQVFNFVLMFSFSLFYTQLRIITVLLLCLEDPFTLWESHSVFWPYSHPPPPCSSSQICPSPTTHSQSHVLFLYFLGKYPTKSRLCWPYTTGDKTTL